MLRHGEFMQKANLSKKARALFLLFQPAIQFFALLLAASLLSRCSPLAPSVEKSALNAAKSAAALSQANAAAAENEKIQAALLDDQLEAQIKEVPARSIVTLSEQDLENTLSKISDAAAVSNQEDFAQASAIVYSQQNRPIVLRLRKQEQEALSTKDGRARLNLIQWLGESDRQTLRKKLDDRSLNAELFFVTNDKDLIGARLPLRLRLGMVFSEHPAAVFYLKRDSRQEPRRSAADEEQLQLAVRAAQALVIVLH
jgi:hypothetical protein